MAIRRLNGHGGTAKLGPHPVTRYGARSSFSTTQPVLVPETKDFLGAAGSIEAVPDVPLVPLL